MTTIPNLILPMEISILSSFPQLLLDIDEVNVIAFPTYVLSGGWALSFPFPLFANPLCECSWIFFVDLSSKLTLCCRPLHHARHSINPSTSLLPTILLYWSVSVQSNVSSIINGFYFRLIYILETHSPRSCHYPLHLLGQGPSSRTFGTSSECVNMGSSDGHPSLVENWTHRALIYLPVTKNLRSVSHKMICVWVFFVTCSTLQVQFKNKGIMSLMNSVSVSAPAAICFLGWVGDVIFFFK